MKTLRAIIVTILLGATNIIHAQDNSVPPPPQPEPIPQYTPAEELALPGYFVLGFGLTQPVGAFNREAVNANNGYALPGGNVTFGAGLPIAHSNFGVALMYNYSGNAFDINNYVNNIQMSDVSRNYAPLYQDAYTENFFLAGLYVTIPINHLSIDFRLMGGPAVCNLPEVAYGAEATSPTATQNFVWHTFGSTSTSLAGDAGMQLRYKLGLFSVMAGIDYTGTDPMINTTQRYTDQFGNATYSHIGGYAPVEILSYNLGIGFQFR